MLDYISEALTKSVLFLTAAERAAAPNMLIKHVSVASGRQSDIFRQFILYSASRINSDYAKDPS